MRMLAAIVTAVAACALLAGCTAPQRAAGEPFVVPQDLSWRYAVSCSESNEITGPAEMSWADGGVNVAFVEDTPENQAAADRIISCLSQYRFAEQRPSFDYVSAYERARLWDYYTRFTTPCLAAQGVTVPYLPRTEFFIPDQRPWNPYTSMNDVPFDRIIELYRTCPPVPRSILARHES